MSEEEVKTESLPAESSLVEKSEDVKENDVEGEQGEDKPEIMDIIGNGQLTKKIIKHGTKDTRPQVTDICNIRLIGKLDDGTIVEDFASLRLQAGENDVIQGIDLAVQLMDVGEVSELRVAPRFAYGSQGLESTIPPNSTITYEIELLKVDPEPDLEAISFDKRRSIATSKRERGNWWYFRQDATKAILCYKKALEVLDDSINYVEDGKVIENLDEHVLKEHLKDRLVILNNLAAAQMVTKAYNSALTSVDSVLRYDPRNMKALYRKGKILAAMGEMGAAVDVLREAVILEPDNAAVKKELSSCLKLLTQHKKHEKDLYKKMFGQDKIEQSSADPNVKVSKKQWTKLLGTIATASVIVAVAVGVSYRFKNYSFL